MTDYGACLDGVTFLPTAQGWRRAESRTLYEAWWCKGGLLHVCRARELRTLCGCSVEPQRLYATAEGVIEETRRSNWMRPPKELPYPWAEGPRCWKCERAILAALGEKTERKK